MPKFTGDRNYQGHHTHTEGLSAEDRYEKGTVLTHWFSGMLQPHHLTGPYLPRADCTGWYASVMFVRKKSHRSETMMSQKNGQWHKATSLWFLHDRHQLLANVEFLHENTVKTNRQHGPHAWWFCCAPDHSVLTCLIRCIFWQSCSPVRKYDAIVIIPSWWQIRPCPLVIIEALHELHRWLWLAEPLTVRVGVYLRAIWSDKALGQDSSEDVYHRAAHSTKCCKKWTESMWEGLRVSQIASPYISCCSWDKWTCGLTLLYFPDIPSLSPGWSDC